MIDYLILGYGYTAPYLEAEIKRLQPQAKVSGTSRKGAASLVFDLENSSTWQNLPQSKISFWLFPAEPHEKVQSFFEHYGDRLGTMVVVGSTGAFQVGGDSDGAVDEKSPLDTTQPRVQGESFLKSKGARLVYSSGIYGPNRNPIRWVEKGYVGKSSKLVNMIHVEDLAHILLQAALKGKDSSTYLASDGRPQSWDNVIDNWQSAGLLKDVPEKQSNRVSKKVNPQRTFNELSIELRHPNFVDWVLSNPNA